jgi:hypothetical protein
LLEDCVIVLYWPADKVGSQIPSRLRPGDLSLVDYTLAISVDLLGRNPLLSCLVRQVLRSFRIRLSRIFWKVFRRSCGPPRSVGSTVRSAGLLVGRTHLSETAMSLVGGDPGYPSLTWFKPPSSPIQHGFFLNVSPTSARAVFRPLCFLY